MTGTALEVDAATYHLDEVGRNAPTLSASVAHLLCTSSPAHARAAHPKLNPHLEREESEKFDIGNAAHGILLEGLDRIVEVDAKDWRTKGAKEEREAAYAAGYTPLLLTQAQRVREMVTAVRAQLGAIDTLGGPPLFADGGRAEQTIVWEEDGIACRALIDWLHADRMTVDDFKTTGGSAAPERWPVGPIFDRGYDVQAVFHSFAVRSLTGSLPEFRFVVAETSPPYAVAVYTLGADAWAVAEAKVAFALRSWGECLAANSWPAYPLAVGTVGLPPWQEPRWLEREARAAA